MGKNKLNQKLVIVAILMIVGGVLIYLSTSNTNIDIEYVFFDDVSQTNNLENNYNLKIGEVKITNNGILPSKIYLKNLKGCINKTTSIIEYTQTIKEYGEVFNGYGQRSVTELSSGESKTLSMVISNQPVRYGLESKSVVSENNSTKTLYIFETEFKTDLYNYKYCIDAEINKAIKTITIN